MNPAVIRAAATRDAAACAAILGHYILNSTANLHGEPLPASYFAGLIEKVQVTRPFIVAENNGDICGYAYADRWRSRCGYLYTVETSVYVAPQQLGGGIGTRLLAKLLAMLEKSPIRTAVAFITLPNPHSVRLHEKLGFVRAGVLPGVGWKFAAAHDVGFWVKNFI